MKKAAKNKTDKFYAKFAFFLSLGFWIPLFNIAICAVSLWLSIKAIKLHMKEPNKYGGFGFAVAGLILSLAGLIGTLVGYALYVFSGAICDSVICQGL